MHEYLASGRPVVSSAIHSVEEFRNVINIATGHQEWSNALEFALSAEENVPARRAERQRTAREYDWDPLVEKIARTIAARLGIQGSPSGLAGAEQVLTRSSLTSTQTFIITNKCKLDKAVYSLIALCITGAASATQGNGDKPGVAPGGPFWVS